MFFASYLIGILTGMGVGSGGLFILYLTMFLDVPQLEAQGLNLYFFLFSTTAAMLLHTRKSHLPYRRLAYLCAVGSLGCAAGASLAQTLDGSLLRKIFAVVLILAGSITLFSGEKKKKMQKTLYK